MANKIITFLFGAAVGSAASYFVCKNYFEKKTQIEIDSVKEAFGRARELKENDESDVKHEEKVEPVTKEKPDIMEYASKLRKDGYTNYSNLEEKPIYADVDEGSKPYVIDESEYGEDDYDVQTMTYYSDGVLARDYGTDVIVEDIEDVVGDALEHFQDDAVYVRDDVLKIDYEITKDVRTFTEVNG